MATSNSRDVKMTLSVDTLGEEGIAKLQQSVASLAKEGGDAAPEFQRLADEIGRLGEQAAPLRTFQELSTVTATLATQQDQAAIAAAELKTKLEGLVTASQAAQTNQQQVATALAEARDAANTTRDALAKLTAQTADAKKADDSYAASVSELKLRKIEQRAEIERLSAAMRAANADVAKAEDAEGKLSAAYERASASAEVAASALRANQAAVAEAAAAAQALGVSTETVAVSQAQLVQGLNQAGTAAAALKAKVSELEAEQRSLAAIKPFEKLAEEARALAQAGQEVNVFDRALQQIVATQREAAAQNNAAKWQQEAAAIVDAAESTKKLIREAEILLATEKELAAQAAFAKQAADARALVQAGEYVRFWREELDKAEQQAARTAQEAKAAAQKIDDAFRTLGTRSAADLRAELTQVRNALETIKTRANSTGESLSGAFAAGEARIKALELEIRRAEGTLTTADKAAALFSNSLGQIAAGNIIADGVGYLVNKVKELGRAFLEAVVQGDQMRRGLTAVYGDARIAAQQIDFLRKSSSESGVAFGALGQEFVKFSASMKLANIPMEQSNALFKALTAASATLGLGTEATAGALNALGQMASKGTVSLEELRAQVGDRLPGALGLAAKGLGITEAQLIKLVESGQLATRDFIEPFTQALNTMKGEVDGIVPSWDRFKGLLTETAQSAGDAGWTQVLNSAIKVLGVSVGFLTLGLSALTEGFFYVAKGLAALAVAFKNPSEAMDIMSEASESARLRLTSQTEAMRNLVAPTQAVGAATTAAAASMTTSTAAVVRAINANTSLTAVQKLVALSTALAGDATLSASAKLVQYSVASAELRATQAAQTDAFEKAAKAAKTQGDTLVELARLTGNTVEIQRASVLAAEMHAAALDRVTASQAAELAMLVAQKAELVDSAAKRGLNAEQIKVQTEALDKLIVKSQAETEQAKQAAAAAEQELLARRLMIETIGDQSAKIKEYTAEVERLKVVLKEYEVLQAQGKKTEEEVLEIRKQLAVATTKQRDAVADLVEKTKLETEFKRDSLRVTTEVLSGEIKLYEAKAKQAKASGDTALATYYEIEAKKKQIEIDKISIQIKEIEIQLEKAEIEVKLAKLKLEEPENALKREKLELELKLNEMKGQSIAASKELLELNTLELDKAIGLAGALRQEASARNENTAAINGETASLKARNAVMEETIAAQEKANELAERAIALENKRKGIDWQGFAVDKKGNRIQTGEETERSVYDKAKGQGLTEEQALKIARDFIVNGRQAGGEFTPDGGGGFISFGARLQKAIDQIVLENARAKADAESRNASSAGVVNKPDTGPQSSNPTPTPPVQTPTPTPPAPTPPAPTPPAPTPAPTPPQESRISNPTTNLTINVAAGVGMTSRADVERMARAIMPAIKDLQRKGLSGS